MKKSLFTPFKNIRTKTSLFVLLLIIITTLILYVVTINIMRFHITNEIILRAESLSQAVAVTASYSFISQDILGPDNIAFNIKESNLDIEYIAITDTQRNILVHSDVNRLGEKLIPAAGEIFKSGKNGMTIKEIPRAKDELIELESPILFLDKTLGSVIIGINKSGLFHAQRKAQKNIIFIFACILFMGITSSIILTSLLTRPIKELSLGVAELKKRKKIKPLKVYSQDELGKLTESFNEMTALILSQQNRLTEYAQDLEAAYLSTVQVLTAAIDARDNYTHGHSSRVAVLSVKLGKEIGLLKSELEELEIACLFHDVGKIRIPDSILLKKDKLNSRELKKMREHPEYGIEILSKSPMLLKYTPVVRHHHECFDGTGYPDGLKGSEIPLMAVILSLADTLDAMTTDRPYRKAYSKEEALEKIHDLSGEKFDPDMVKIFERLIIKNTKALPEKQTG